ncbi:MAG: hypothetical protein BWY09_02527 [Candidatus Hydrogenedentes bacterium ADurb.Bin179]|nr:MAG: hypothetical protein BWY09_02527 [Candidatus Hydrogenedentes bacterium ADurb.Bin179]
MLLGQYLQDAFDVRKETHVQHAVRLVQHQYRQVVKARVATVDVIEEPAGTRHYDVDALAKRLRLRLYTYATVNRRRRQIHVFAKHLENIVYLNGQFPGRCQHQHTVATSPGPGKLCQCRQAKGQRLSRARLCHCDNVTPFKSGRDGFRLDRGWFANSLSLKHTETTWINRVVLE